VTAMTPLLNGAHAPTAIPRGGFATSAMNGNTVVYLTGRTTCACATIPGSDVIAGLLSTNGVGIAALTYDQNCDRHIDFSKPHRGHTTSPATAERRSGSEGPTLLRTWLAPIRASLSCQTVLLGQAFGEAQAAGSFSQQPRLWVDTLG